MSKHYLFALLILTSINLAAQKKDSATFKETIISASKKTSPLSSKTLILNSPNYIAVNENDEFTIQPDIRFVPRQNNLLKGALKLIGIGAITYQVNNHVAKNTKEGSVKAANTNPLPSIGLGLLVASPDLIKAIKTNSKLSLRYSLYNKDSVLVSQQVYPLTKKGNHIFKGKVKEDGFLQIDIVSSIRNKAKLESIWVGIKTKSKKFKGAITENMALRSEGECLPGVCVKSPTYSSNYVTQGDGSVWLVTCTTNYENCEDESGSTDCDNGVMISGPIDNPYTETVTEQNGCQLCTTIITHHTDGSADEFNSLGCEEIPGCNPTDEEPVTNDYQDNHATMCGSYNWGTIGNAYYTQFKPIGFSLVNSGGAILGVSYGSPCIQFSKSNVYNTTLADKAWNDAWNYAMEKVTYDCNHNGPLDDFRLKQNVTKYIKEYIKINYPGSSFNPSGCEGSNLPYSKPEYCLN